MSDPRSTYRNIVFGGLTDGVDEEGKPRQKMKKAALRLAHDIRKFEI